jgi:hypothetical protein
MGSEIRRMLRNLKKQKQASTLSTTHVAVEHAMHDMQDYSRVCVARDKCSRECFMTRACSR